MRELALVHTALLGLRPPAALRPVADGAWQGWSIAEDGRQLTAMMDPYWLALSRPVASPVVAGSDAGGAPDAEDALRVALQASRSQHMVKYSLEQRHLLAEVEIPRSSLDAPYVQRAIEALLRAAPAPLTAATAEAGEPFEAISTNEIYVYFRSVAHLGWVPKEPARPDEWHAVIYGFDRRYDLYLSLNRFWATFQIPLLTSADIAAAGPSLSAGVLCRHLVETNPRLCWAKLGMDEQGQVLLLLDVPIESLDLHQFRFAAQTLNHYLHWVGYDLQVLASLPRDPELAALLQSCAALSAPEVSHTLERTWTAKPTTR